MSAVWLKIVAVLWLCYAELSEAGVMWKNVGEFITIQCRAADSKQELLYLKRGIFEEEEIFYRMKSSSDGTIKNYMKERVQTDVKFPNVDIVIKNLTVNDTGPYWCLYGAIDNNRNLQITKSRGSVLLVVTDNRPAAAANEMLVCEPSHLNMIILSAVAFAAILLVVMMFLIIRLTRKKTKSSSSSVKTGRLTTNNNDVYEDMRGTIRR